MIPLDSNNITVNTSNTLKQMFNILPGNTFCNNSSIVFEKELLHAFKSTKTPGSRNIEKHIPLSQTHHTRAYQTSNGHSPAHMHRKGKSESGPKTQEAQETSSSSDESSKSDSTERHVHHDQKTLIDFLNSALLIMGYSPGEATRIIEAFQQGDFSNLNSLMETPNNQTIKSLWQSEAGFPNANSLTNMDPQLQNLLASLMTASSDTNITGKLQDTMNQLTTALSKLHIAKGLTGQNKESSDMLTEILSTGISAKSQEIIPDISSSLAYWIGSGLENGETSVMAGLQQMVQNIFVTGTTKQHSSADLNEIVAKFNLTPLTNQTFGFTNLPLDEVPLLMNSSFVDQLAARLTSMATMGKDQLTFAIQPPELGSLRVLIRVNQGNVQSLIQASSEEVKQLLNSKTHDLRHMLEQQGLNLTDFKVSLVQTTSNTGETWNFTWNDSRENRQSSNPKEERNFRRNKRNDKNFSEQLDIIT